ncbi:hypothetical protein BO94DRAFT_299856 [Aspergillus sclerotioniger CBS 115572]|uniref:DUF1446-domain-containing protein n=1 Tax=Aspergillus sclerotioniger CBS 115572 TaxID=1450535 RepID=A0A317V839_9EURO|nr:hypothetical protein BO94DRAFT_299856 [Aspergillus sclerotioniger CBS 115572]PWY68992.1 hypothetical protein BO94DRAFT_299856 [Aspergillus sclerotioniger CBS 115572]
MSTQELKILTPIGMLGYGFDESLFWSAVSNGVDAIICDSGSTDSGPARLALGTMSGSREAYSAEMEKFLLAAHHFHVPVLIGSAGGDGANDHVDIFVDIIDEIIARLHLRPMKVVKIYAEVSKDIVRSELAAGRIVPCGEAVPQLQLDDVEDASRIVAQMGIEPYLKAMEENPDFDVIIGGRSYDPAPYAAFCVHKGFTNLDIAWHMGKIMECGALCAKPKSREALAIVRHDSFDIRPLNPSSRCTAVSVAAHTLYEKTRPDILLGPGGSLHLEDTTYEELPDNRTVRVRGAKFIPVEQGQYTVKLEAARTRGYHSCFFGGFTDPILISQVDSFIQTVRDHVAMVCKFPYDLKLTTYGSRNEISMFADTNQGALPPSIAIHGDARAETQAQATRVIHAARVGCMHGSYLGQVATSGNFAMPCAPLDIPMGRVCEFCIYHLMLVDDPTALFHISAEVIQHSSDEEPPELVIPAYAPKVQSSTDAKQENNLPRTTRLSPSSPPGMRYLGEFASVIRSKNAGPYELTFDIMFDSLEKYFFAKSSGVLDVAKFAKLYDIEISDIVAAVWWEPAMALKVTVKRPIVSGRFGETDTHGSCQHARLLRVLIPAMEHVPVDD